MRQGRKWLAAVLALGMILTGTVSAAASGTAEVQQKKNELQNKISEKEKEITALEKQKNSIMKTIQELDKQNAEAQEKLDEINSQIESKEQDIEKNNTRLAEAEEEEQIQYRNMKKRIQYLYEKGNASLMQIFLEAEDFSEILNRTEYFTQLTSYDREKLLEYKKVCQEITDLKAKLKEEKEELSQYKSSAEKEKSRIEKAISAKQTEIEKFESGITQAEKEQADFEGNLEVQNRILAQIEAEAAKKAEAEKAAAIKAAQEKAAAQKAEEEKKEQNQQPEKPDTGNQGNSSEAGSSGSGDSGSGLLWPCPASGSISSYFGYRESPTAGASSYHQGIDIPAGTGSSIIAAASGTVTTATYSQSAGNYVTIDHGNGLHTVYMHCSALYVSAGQRVSAGQSIAAVGSTGYSTGPHLHFGVMSGGSYVDPMNYL